MKKETSELKKERYHIGFAILTLMEKKNDLPLKNINLLSFTMQKYYKKYGGDNAAMDIGGKWRPNQKYWSQNIGEISKYMAEEYKIYFGFLRTKGLKGIWKFMDKQEYLKYLKFHNQDISTRVDTQNEKIELAEGKWIIDIPKIADVPRLT